MKKTLLLGVFAMMATMFASCGGNGTPVVQPGQPTPSAKTVVNVLRQSATPTPDWVSGPTYQVGSQDGVPTIFLVVEGEAPTKDAAKAKAEGDRIKNMANSIKQLATTEFAIAKQGMLNNETEMDQYFEETIAAVSRNVNVSGAFPIAQYWEQMELIEASASKTVWRYVLRYSLDKKVYDQAKADAWKKATDSITNPELKDKAQKVLSSIQG